MESVLGLAEDQEVFTKALCSLSDAGRINRFLELMLDYTKGAIPLDNAPNIVAVLMNIGDFFPDEKVGMFDVDASMKILRVFFQLGKRYETQTERFELLKLAMEEAQESLWTAVHQVGILGQEHGKVTHKEQPTPEEKRAVDADQLTALEQIALKKIRDWEVSGRLSSHLSLAAILYSWERLMPEGSDEVKTYVSSLIKTTEGLLIFVTAFLSQSTSHTMGDSMSRRNWRIALKNIADFTDPDDVIARLRDVRELAGFSELDERQKIATNLYLDTVDGKVEDW
jgi:hypothetical protein